MGSISASWNSFIRELARLLKRDWRYFLWISLLLVLGIGVGANLPKHSPLAEQIYQSAFRKLADLKQWYIHAPLLGKIVLIWGNNIFASLTAVFSGILLLPPVLFLLENGIVIGLVQKLAGLKAGMGPVWFYLSLAPHGVFELPAFVIACALGIRFGMIPWRFVYNDLRKRPGRPLFREFFTELRYYAVFLLLVLLVAAVLEVTVSSVLVQTPGAKL